MMMLKSIEFLRGVLVKEQGVIKITSKFVIKDFDHLVEVIGNIERVVQVFPQLSENKGYINNSKINLPLVEFVIQQIMDGKYRKDNEYYINPHTSSVYSILMNKIVYYMIMLLMLMLVYKIEDWIKSNEHDIAIKLIDEGSRQSLADTIEDLKTLKRSIIRMLHPVINKKLSNRGLSVTLNAYSGFDAEFTQLDEEKQLNKVLSMQVSSNAGLYVRVPIIDVKPLRSFDLSIDEKRLWGNEKILTIIGLSSMDRIIYEIRELLYYSNDEIINMLITKLSEDPTVRKCIVNGDWVFSFPKSEKKDYIKYFNEGDHYSSIDLIKQCEKMVNDDHKSSLYKVIEILNDLSGNEMTKEMSKSIDSSCTKHSSRITYRFKNSVFSITISRVLYLLVHLSYADLPLLIDFDQLKEELDMVAKSFVTRGKPLIREKFNIKLHIRDTTLLSPTPSASLASIGSIYGPDYKKVDLGSYRKEEMDVLLNKDRALFERYALQDSIITLKHGNTMEEFNFMIGKLGVPLTISGIGKSYVLQQWSNIKYGGYQVVSNVKIGDLSSLMTPKSTRSVDIANYIVPYITAYRGGRNESFMYGYKNIENKDVSFYDYDLTSAYTTVMSILGHPDVEKAGRLYNKTVKEMTPDQLLLNYIVLDVEFKFPSNTKYPCIPARVDDNIEIYPLEGRSTITGAEYLVAKSMGCRLLVKSGVMIPFDLNKKESIDKNKKESIDINKKESIDINKKVDKVSESNDKSSNIDVKVTILPDGGKTYDITDDSEKMLSEMVLKNPELLKEKEILVQKGKYHDLIYLTDIKRFWYKHNEEGLKDQEEREKRNKELKELSRLNYMSPYRGIMLNLQSKRRTYAKGTFDNLMYKLIGNSIYGQVSMGLSGRTVYDIRSKTYIKVDAGELTNPILASYITGFTRAAVSELMHNTWLLKGNIISVTTDGFIADIADLENKIMENPKLIKHCLQLYRDLRRILTSVKDEYGNEKYDNSALEVKFIEKQGITSWKTRGQMGDSNPGILALTGFQAKYFQKEFLQDMIPGLVTDPTKPKKVEFIESGLRTPTDIYKKGGHIQMKYRDKSYSFEYDNKRRIVENQQNDNLLDSVPWKTVEDYRKIRVLKETVSTAPFKEGSFNSSGYIKKYKIKLETGVRSFIKACFSDKNRYGIPVDYFPNYDTIIKFIHGYAPAQSIKLTKSSISNLRNRETIPRAVPRIKENEDFIKYVKQFIDFDSDLFFRELSEEAIRTKKKAAKAAKSNESK